MADYFKLWKAADVALGKPAVPHFPLTASVADAIKALQQTSDGRISVWQCRRPQLQQPPPPKVKDSGPTAPASCRKEEPLIQDKCLGFGQQECKCVGILTKVDILCHLAEEWRNRDRALRTCVSELLPPFSSAVAHVDGKSRLLDALSPMADLGAHHLVLRMEESRRRTRPGPIFCHSSKPAPAPAPAGSCQPYCCLTQEDVLRFLLSFIARVGNAPLMTVEELGIIDTNFQRINACAPAASGLDLIKAASQEMTAVAVVEELSCPDYLSGEELSGDRLVGDLSAFSMRNCDETAAEALATLSVKEFLDFAGGDVAALLRVRRQRSGHGLTSFLPAGWEESSSEDESSGLPSPTGPLQASFESMPRPWQQCHLFTTQSGIQARVAPITCRPQSTLVAVMAQALANRVTYLWVTDDNDILIGLVTFRSIIEVLVYNLESLETAY